MARNNKTEVTLTDGERVVIALAAKRAEKSMAGFFRDAAMEAAKKRYKPQGNKAQKVAV